jgi:hypothetical protein
MDGMNLPARDRLQALVDPRRAFEVASPLSPEQAATRLREVIRDRRSLFQGDPGPPVRLVYVPNVPMTPFRPVLEGEIEPEHGGSLIEGTARLSWALRIFAGVVLAYLVVYGVAGVAYAATTGELVAALSVLAFPAGALLQRFYASLFVRQARRAVGELEAMTRAEPPPARSDTL